MRVLTLLLLLFTASPLLAQTGEESVIFNTYEWNFGDIKEADGAVSHIFLLKNSGSKPTRITRAIPSCSCIMANFPKKDIQPGEVVEVEVFLSPSGAAGKTFRSIEFASSKGSMGTLSVWANVTPADESIQKRYSTVLSDMIYVNRSKIPFGYVGHGQSLSKVIYIANAADKAAEIELKVRGSHKAEVSGPSYLAPSAEEPIMITYTMPSDKKSFATYADTLDVIVNGKKVSKPLLLSAICLDKPAASANAPCMVTTPSVGELKKSLLSGKYSGYVSISNTGKSPLVLHFIENPQGVKLNLKNGETIAPGKTVKLYVEDVKAKEVRLNLFTNDPQRPYKETILKTN